MVEELSIYGVSVARWCVSIKPNEVGMQCTNLAYWGRERRSLIFPHFNPLHCRGNYSATSNDMKLVHWPLMGGAVTFGTAMRGLGVAAARPGPSSLYQM